MRALLAAFAIAMCGEAFAADPPAKKVEPPYALLKFSDDLTLDKWTSTFEMTTASGATYELAIDFGDGFLFYAESLKALLAVNWVVEPSKRSVKIYGVRTKEGKTDAVKSLTITNKLRSGMGQKPTLTAFNGAKVEVKTDDGKAKPDPARKVSPKGPEFPDETFVEFDLSTLPPGMDEVFWEMTWEVRTTAGKERPWTHTHQVLSDGAAEICLNVMDATSQIARAGFKAERVGKTKLRVYGGVYEGKYYPAMRGSVTSPQLKPEQLPKITNPKRL